MSLHNIKRSCYTILNTTNKLGEISQSIYGKEVPMDTVQMLHTYAKRKKGVRGSITTSELKKHNITAYQLRKMTQSGDVLHITRGLYLLDGYQLDEFYVIQHILGDCIFSFGTALQFHGLSYFSHDICVSISKGRKTPRLYNEHPHVSVTFAEKQTLFLGSEKAQTTMGTEIYIYSLERLFCEYIIHQRTHELGFQLCVRKLKETQQQSLNKIKYYAKELSIQDNNDYLEILHSLE